MAIQKKPISKKIPLIDAVIKGKYVKIAKNTKIYRVQKTGRPTKYHPKYCQQIIDYFNVDPIEYKNMTVPRFDKDGNTIESKDKIVKIWVRLPMLYKFAMSIGITADTLWDWTNEHKEFRDAYNVAKQIQLEHLLHHGLNGTYNSFLTFQTLKNMCGWRDKQDHEITGSIKLEIVHQTMKGFVDVVARHIKDPKTVARIADELLKIAEQK